jgi:hypothetical protein
MINIPGFEFWSMGSKLHQYEKLSDKVIHYRVTI